MEKKNYLKELLSTVFIFALVAVAFRMCSGSKKEQEGFFVFGRVVKVDVVQGHNYLAVSFPGIGGFRTAFLQVASQGKVGDLYFVKVWKDYPDKVAFDQELKVPACFDTTGYPKEGILKFHSALNGYKRLMILTRFILPCHENGRAVFMSC